MADPWDNMTAQPPVQQVFMMPMPVQQMPVQQVPVQMPGQQVPGQQVQMPQVQVQQVPMQQPQQQAMFAPQMVPQQAATAQQMMYVVPMQLPIGMQGQAVPGVQMGAPSATGVPQGFVPMLMQQAPAAAATEPAGGAGSGVEAGGDADGVKPVVMRASAATSFQKLAGALAKRLRQEGSLEIEAMGATAVAHAVRAMVLARSFLFEDLTSFDVDVFFTVREQNEDAHPSLRFAITRKDSIRDVSVADAPKVVIDVGAVGKTAGLIAKNARAEPGTVRHMICGPCASSINTAAKALARARLILDGVHIGLKMQPVSTPDLEQPLSFALIPYSAERPGRPAV